MKLPKDFESYFLERWHSEDVEALVRGLQAEPSVSIRLNPRRMPIDVEPEGADGRVPWCEEGFYLADRPAFTADPLLHAGAYYVQEASSMYLAHVVRHLLPMMEEDGLSACLDLCAAPGGKSTLLRSVLPESCFLVSNEPLRQRAQVLAENMAKWCGLEAYVTQAYARDFSKALRGKQFFDLILADVPCSGEGMMRKEAAAVEQWSPAFVAECAALQRSIIEDIWPALRPGGILLYSTCTFNPEEDEENVEWIVRELGAELLSIPTESNWSIRSDLRREGHLSVAHFLPGEVRGEGFFCAALQKLGKGLSAKNPQALRKTLSVIPTLSTSQLDVAEDVRSKQQTTITLPRVDLSLADAVRYLQREALTLPSTAPRGIVQVCFHGQRLGLVKNLGTRANNLYPKEWRIRSTYTVPHSIFYQE